MLPCEELEEFGDFDMTKRGCFKYLTNFHYEEGLCFAGLLL